MFVSCTRTLKCSFQIVKEITQGSEYKALTQRKSAPYLCLLNSLYIFNWLIYLRWRFKAHLHFLKCLFVCLQYDFVELLDGSRLIAKEHRAPSELDQPVLIHQAGFIQYLDSGVWHLAFYNDGRNVEAVSYNTIIQGTQMFLHAGMLYRAEL